ncbi:MAG: immunoglobulin domain-containing protein [Bacteroidales bacterium]|nr:immunoglobulin domain-containing protein [Bacteroidales bacterium]
MRKRPGVLFIILFFILFNLQGQSPTWNWANSIHTNQEESAYDIVEDPVTGNIYIAGYFEDDLSAFFPTGGTSSTNFTTLYGGNSDGFLAKYDNLGNLIWAFKTGCDREDRINAITLDPSGNIYITGYFEDNTAQFTGVSALTGTTSLTNTDNTRDVFVAKYNADGALLWVRQSTGTKDAEGLDIAADNSGVYIVGYYNDNITFGTITIPDLGVRNQYYALKYDVNGNELWSARGEVNNSDFTLDNFFKAVATDGSNVFILGTFKGNNLDVFNTSNTQVASTTNSQSGRTDMVLLSFTVNGAYNWIQRIGGNTDEVGHSLTLVGDSIYLTGGMGNNANFPSYANNPLSSSGNKDVFISSHAKSDGKTGWVKSFPCTDGGNEVGYAITADINDNLFVTGVFKGDLDVAGTTISSNGGEDIFIVSFSNDGNFIWAKNTGSNGNDNGFGISSNSSDKLYVCGFYENLIDFDGISLPDDGQNNVFFAQIDPCLDAVGGNTATADALICAGDSTIITLSGYLGTISWQSSPAGLNTWSTIAGQTLSDITVSPVVNTDYRAVLANGTCSSDFSDIQTIIVNPLPTGVISGNATICSGTPTPINIDLTGTAPYNFNYTNGVGTFNVPANATDNFTTNVSPGSSLNYTLLDITDNNGCVNTGTGSAVIVVNPPVSITTQPVSKGVCPGVNTSFSVNAAGMDLSFQWQKNGVNIAGAINPVLNINSVTAADVATYTCIVSSSCGGPLTSNNAGLSLYSPVVITTQPVGANLCFNEDLNLGIAATGSGLTYQWKKNGINIAGETSNLFSILNTTTADNGVYTCEVSGSCGIVESDLATVSVEESIVITGQPTNKQACPGSNISFTVTATGSNLSFQWQKNGINIAGENTQSLVINSVAAGDAGNYRCVVSSPCGASIISSTAILTVNLTTVISSHPAGVIACLSANTSFTVVAAGTGLTYQWKKNGINLIDGGSLSGTTTNKLIITGLAVADAGSYICQVSGSCGILNCNPANLVVDDAITITTQPQDKQACVGESINFNLVATGSNLSYQWQKDGINIPGAINSSLSLNSIVAGDAGIYHCVISNSCGSTLSSNMVDLVINNITIITSAPSDAVECEGENVSFGITATGTNLSWQWKKDGVNLANGATVSGAQSNTLFLSNLTSAENGTYFCVVSGSCGSLNSDPAELLVDDNIVITNQPQDLQTCAGDNVSFDVVATGSNLNYQWQKDGVNIPGETNPTLSLNSIVAANVGAYRCVLDNSCGSSVTSEVADLTLITNTSITSQPVNKTVCEGGNVSFIVTAIGSNLSYQWRKNGINLANGGNVSGALSNTLVLSLLTTADAAVYTCEVSGDCGIINSDPANLTIDEKVIITQHPVNSTLCPGENASFNITATGALLNYQWQKDGANIAGETNPGLIIPGIDATDAGVYRCIVTGNCGAVISNGASLTVNVDVSVTTQPADMEICAGENAGFVIVANGTGLSYQWKQNGVSLVTGGSITGATGNNLTINPAATANAGIYTCEITGTCGIINSDPADLIVNENISISGHPQNKTACPGENVIFSVTASGANLTYQWQKNGANLAGETNSGLILNTVNAANAGTYRCIVSGDCGSLISNGAQLTVNQDISINQQPLGAVICEGENAGFTISATGTGLTYQWKRNGINLSDGGAVSGSTGNSLSIDPAVAGNAGLYSCEVTGSCGTENSAPANLVVNKNVVITAQPQNLTACPGENANFSVAATGTNLSYQWQKDGVNMAGEISTGLVLTNINATDAGIYTCIITGDCNTIASIGAILTVNEAVLITVQPPANVNLCEGDNLDLQVNATGTNKLFQWTKNGTDLADGGDISGATTDNLIINNLIPSDLGIYTCRVNTDCGTENSNLTSLNVNPATIITQQPAHYTIVSGGDAQFSVLAEGNGLTYQWQKDGINLSDGGVISGSTTSILLLTGVSETDEGAYRCIVTGTCGTANSNPGNLTVNPTTIFITQPASITKCQGQSAGFSVVVSGSGLSYQWKKDGADLTDNVNVSGSTSATLTIGSAAVSDMGAYTCMVNGENSAPAILTVNKNTGITTQPAGASLCETDLAMLSVQASGTSLIYQWQKDGANLSNGGTLSGATSDVLSISGIIPTDNGVYKCVVTGTCGSVNSDPATLVAYKNTVITLQPANQTLCEGGTIALNITADGDNLLYTWKRNGVTVTNGGNISGATSASLTIVNATEANSGSYTCQVSGNCGTKNSTLAIVTVNPSATITAQPVDISACSSDNVSFAIAATGSGLAYQWQKDGANISDGGTISGCLTDILSIAGTLPGDAGTYTCVVTGVCGSDNSDPAVLTSYQNTLITSQPVDKTVCEGTTSSFNVVASGDNLSYQWKKDGVILSNGGNLSGATSPNLIFSSVNLSDAGFYTCLVSGSCGNENSDLTELTVNSLTTISSHPAGDTRCSGDNISFIVLADGENLNYQWQKGGMNIADGGTISGATTPVLTINGILPVNAGAYSAVVSGSCGTLNSDPANLAVNSYVTITGQPSGDTICQGESTILAVTATGQGLSYQWKKEGVNLTDGGNISGSNTSTLQINNATTIEGGMYTCLVTGYCGNENSSPARLVVNKNTTIIDQPLDLSLCTGDMAVFKVTASGANLAYQWEKDGVSLSNGGNIFGVDNSILTVTGLTTSDAGTYRCVVTGTCNTVYSDPADLVINVYPNAAGLITGSASVCQGEQQVLYEVTSISNADSYVWTLPVGVNITSGGNSRLIEVSFALNESGGSISVYAENVCGAGPESPVLTVVANPIPIANADEDQNLCASTATLNGNDPGIANGLWAAVNGPAVIQNTTLYNSTVSDLRQGENKFTWTVTENGCSAIDTVVINNNLTTIDAGGNLTICAGNIDLQATPVPVGAFGSWSVVSGSASFADGTNPATNASGFSSGINKLKWTVSKSGCINTDSVTINYQMPTIAYAGIDQSLCKDSTILAGNGPSIGTGQWTIITGSAFIQNPASYNSQIKNLGKGDNILRWTISNGICSSIDEVTISNNKVNVNAGIDKVICDRTTTLGATAPSAGTGTWSVINGSGLFVNINAPDSKVTGLSQGINTLQWMVNHNSCLSYDTVTITNDLPTVADAGDDQVLTVDYTTLQGNIPTIGAGSWVLISGSAVIADASLYNTNVSALNYGENTFRWTIAHNSCISADDVIITNFTPNTTNAGEDQTLCVNYTILEGNEPLYGFGEWSVIQGAATFEDNSQFDTKVTSLAPGDNILRWTVWENGYTFDDVVITNNAPSMANAGSDQTMCADSAMLAANNPIIGAGVWTVVGGSATFADSSLFNSKVISLAKGENFLKWTINYKGCILSDIVKITNNLPTLAQAGEDQVVCTNYATLLPNTPTVGAGNWSVISGSGTFTGNDVTRLASGDNILRWTISNNSCSSYDELIITNNKPSTANAGADKVICYDSLTLAANNPVIGTGKWTIQSGSLTFADDTQGNTKVTNIGKDLNVLRWTISYNGCVSFDEVTVNNALDEALTGTDQVLCATSTILEANNPEMGTGSWSIIGGSGSAVFENPNQPDTRVTGLSKGNNILRWTIENEICVSTSDVIITNNLPTQPFAGPDQTLCADLATLQANTPEVGTGEWTILSGSGVLANPAIANSTITNLNTGVNLLRWTIRNLGCVLSDEVLINNNATVASMAGEDQVLCSDSTTLYGNVPSNGLTNWVVVRGSATFEDNSYFNTSVTNLGQGDNVLRWVITDGNCSSSDEVIITNNTPTKAVAGSDQAICGDGTGLHANIPVVGQGNWSIISGAGSFADSNNYNTVVSGLNAGDNRLRWTITNNGCSFFDDVIIRNNLPFVADAGPDIEVCSEAVDIYANNPLGGSGQWSVISGTALFTDATNYNTKASGLGFGANTLRWTLNFGECSSSDEIIITNNQTEIYAGIDQTVGESSTILAANNPTIGSGIWSVIGGSGSFSETNNFITEVSGLGSGLNTFRWAITINGCISYDDVSVIYNVPPIASFVANKYAGCPPLEVYFVNNSLDELPFTWNFGDGTSSSEVTVKHTYSEPGEYMASLTVTGNAGEIVTSDTVIVVHELPQASFDIYPEKIYLPDQKVNLVNTSVNAEAYLWMFGDGNTSEEMHPSHQYSVEGAYDISLYAWTEHMCFDSVTRYSAVIAEESGGITFPNAFTPNLGGPSDGSYSASDFSNDVFHPVGEGVEEYHLEIYNRWGILLFESFDLAVGWDGYYKGEIIEKGVYVWKVSGKFNNGKPFEKMGTVMLLH